jgi:hypothetical protein
VCFARGTFEPRPFKGIPTVVRLGAPWGLGVPRASPPGRSPGWWGVARGPPFLFLSSVLRVCACPCFQCFLCFPCFLFFLLLTVLSYCSTLVVCFCLLLYGYGCVLSTQSRSGLWGIGTGQGNYAGYWRECGRVCARRVAEYALSRARVHFSPRASLFSRRAHHSHFLAALSPRVAARWRACQAARARRR